MFAVCPDCFAVGVNVSLCFLTVFSAVTHCSHLGTLLTLLLNDLLVYLHLVVFHVTVVPSGKPIFILLSSTFGTVPLSTIVL